MPTKFGAFLIPESWFIDADSSSPMNNIDKNIITAIIIPPKIIPVLISAYILTSQSR
jgi:hypothetical protein